MNLFKYLTCTLFLTGIFACSDQSSTPPSVSEAKQTEVTQEKTPVYKKYSAN